LALAAAGGPAWSAALAAGTALSALGAAAEARRRHVRLRGALRLLEAAAEPVDTARYACAGADGPRAAGRPTAGADGGRIRVDADGVYRYTLTGAGAQAAEDFTTALDEVLAPDR